MRIRTMAATAAALAVAGAGLLGPGATAAPPPEAPGADPTAAAEWSSSGSTWNDPNDAGGVSVYEKTSNLDTGASVLGQFIAYGEKVGIIDHHDNDRKAIVKLWVGGSGPAVFYGNGDGTERVVDRSYDEGQSVYVQVCTSDSANAVCSDKEYKGTS